MPIDQLGTVSVPEARLISIQVWDKANITLIDSAIQKSELGINPQIDGQIIRLRVPDLTEWRKDYIAKFNTMKSTFITFSQNLINEVVSCEYDEDTCQTHLKAWGKTEKDEYEVKGKVLSLIPLRNRREDPNGNMLNTRIAEGMTEYTYNGQTGYGMSEYLDQIIDGKPVGP